MSLTAHFVLVATLALSGIECRVYSRCELAQDMINRDTFHDQINDWVCLVESESSRDSMATQGPNTDGSYDYGLFQINDRYWCGASGPGGDCNIACQSLLVDDGVGASESCAGLIYSRMGFDAWVGWGNKCKGQALPDVYSECGLKAFKNSQTVNSTEAAPATINESKITPTPTKPAVSNLNLLVKNYANSLTRNGPLPKGFQSATARIIPIPANLASKVVSSPAIKVASK